MQPLPSPKRTVNLRIDAALYEKVRELAGSRGTTISRLVVDALALLLKAGEAK